MGKIMIGLNLEFSRHDDKPFAWAVAEAAKLGYEYIKPMVHWGHELMSMAGYFHSVSMFDDPMEVAELCAKHHVTCSGISAHCPIVQPDIGVRFLTQSIRWTYELGCRIVNTDEGVKADFTDAETDHLLAKYTLTKAAREAERRKMVIGLEQHQIYSKTPAGLDRLYQLVDSPAIGINFDTGNAYLAGADPRARRLPPGQHGPGPRRPRPRRRPLRLGDGHPRRPARGPRLHAHLLGGGQRPAARGRRRQPAARDTGAGLPHPRGADRDTERATQ